MFKKFSLLCFCFCLLCCLCLPADAKNKKEAAAETVQPLEIITVEEMEQRFATAEGDLLYVKLKDERVEVYEGLAENRSLRKQLILALPPTEMLRLYTTQKETYRQMSRMLLDYEEDNYNFDGYKIITDVDAPKKLENGIQVYRFWFMKIRREKASRRGASFPIGIGIGIGHHRHHRHGPWIGVGW